MLEFLFIILLIIYALDSIGLLYFGLHSYVMLVLYMKNHEKCKVNEKNINSFVKKIKKYPNVTVQLPIFNEYYVVERLIDSIIALEYPKSKLEIQVLDDSTDESKILAEKKVKEYKKKGFDIKHIHRKDRKGHKAGALKNGLELAKGEFIAIFDADFIPTTDFLKKTVPFFYEDKKIGMVQTRWGHVNENYSFLTKAQSIGVDGHFIIEQVARNGSRLWMNFNGTAGIWRKECILSAGNWQSDTLTEDFDLSYRAELKGWRFKYLSNIICPAELPSTVSAYKSQQFRWCKGSLQTAVKLIPKIIRAKLKWQVKAEAITHLVNYSVHPLIYLNILLTPLLIFTGARLKASSEILISIVLIGAVGPIVFYAFSQKCLYKNWKKRLIWLPFLTMIGSGIALNNTKAWLEGIMGKKSTFIRTPKLGIVSKDKKQIIKNRFKYSKPKINGMIIIELLTVFYILTTIILAFESSYWLMIPFLLIYFFGFLYISSLSFYDLLSNFILLRKKMVKSTKI